MDFRHSTKGGCFVELSCPPYNPSAQYEQSKLHFIVNSQSSKKLIRLAGSIAGSKTLKLDIYSWHNSQSVADKLIS